jgi:outer membrane protein TolC
MKRFNLLLIFWLFALFTSAQEIKKVNLGMLHKLIGEVGRMSTLERAIDSVQQLQSKNISTVWLPKFDANAQATWQSDVVSISIPFPGVSIPSPTNDQYKLTLDASQVIWDGGFSAERKKVTEAQAATDKSVVKLEIYNARERINDAFFGILALDMSLKQLKLLENELESRINEMEGRVKEGVVLPSAVNQLKAEKLKLQQRLMEIPSRRLSLITIIETLTQTEIDKEAVFVEPSISEISSSGILNPEFLLFDTQNALLDASMGLTSRKRYPTIAAFASAGYGKPGLNMISNDWDFFTIVGAKASWNLWDWNSTHREKEQLRIRKNMNNIRRMAVSDALQIKIKSSEFEIAMLRKQLENDRQIIELLDQSEKETASRLLNGVVSANDYLLTLNAVTRAKIEMELRNLSITREKVRIAFYYGYDL